MEPKASVGGESEGKNSILRGTRKRIKFLWGESDFSAVMGSTPSTEAPVSRAQLGKNQQKGTRPKKAKKKMEWIYEWLVNVQ